MLAVENLHAYYGKSHILQGVDFTVGAGEIVSLLGRNGAGRSTTIKAVMGEVPPHGSIRFKGEEIAGRKPHEIAAACLAVQRCAPLAKDLLQFLVRNVGELADRFQSQC